MRERSSFGGGYKQQGPTRGRIDGWSSLSYHGTRSFGRAAPSQEIGDTIPRPTDVPPISALHALLVRWEPCWSPSARGAASLAIVPARSGSSTPVWRVKATWTDHSSETFYLRLGEEPGERRDGEIRIHQLLAMQGVPVPEIVAWEGAPPELDRAATLTRAIPGMALGEVAIKPETLAALAQRAGQDLARINALPVAGFGWIDLPDATTGALRAECLTRGAWVAEYDRELGFVLENRLIPHEHVPALRVAFAIWRNSAPETSTRSVLAHGDFDISHIFCAPNDEADPSYTYTGIIDFGEARGADPFYDLGHALMHDGAGTTPPVFACLLAGYREIIPLPDNAWELIRAQAIATGVRRLAIAHRRNSPHAHEVAGRMLHILNTDGAPSNTRA